MAKFRVLSFRARAGVVIACAALLMSVMGSGPADAAAGKTVKAKNANVLVTCTFKVLKVNPSDGTTQIRVTAQAQPSNIFGYGNNAYTQATCAVYNDDFDLVAYYSPFGNSASLPTTSITPNVPTTSTYYLCASGFVKLTNGNQSSTATVCA